jgi:hypothetical protein
MTNPIESKTALPLSSDTKRKTIVTFGLAIRRLPGTACLFLALALAVGGCSREKPFSLSDCLPGTNVVAGWTPDGEPRILNQDTIYNLVDGQAVAFFAYGFQQVAVQNYMNAEEAGLSIEVWQLATPPDAYGLFTAGAYGIPIKIGQANEVASEPGRRLVFWQDRFFVNVRARQELPDSDLQSFAEAVSKALPSGGTRPALMDRLPTEAMVAQSTFFFHEEISIQNEIWLGGENILGLSQETDGALARYNLDGTTARLILVQYPTAAPASAGLAALKGAGVDSLVVADVSDNLLGAVFGEVDRAIAEALLAKALAGK